jgi:hypothetical protein
VEKRPFGEAKSMREDNVAVGYKMSMFVGKASECVPLKCLSLYDDTSGSIKSGNYTTA